MNHWQCFVSTYEFMREKVSNLSLSLSIYIYIYIDDVKCMWEMLLLKKFTDHKKTSNFRIYEYLHAQCPGDLGSISGRVKPKTLKKWYMIPPCLTLSIIRYVSRVKWSNSGKGVAPSTTPRCSSFWKGSL